MYDEEGTLIVSVKVKDEEGAVFFADDQTVIVEDKGWELLGLTMFQWIQISIALFFGVVGIVVTWKRHQASHPKEKKPEPKQESQSAAKPETTQSPASIPPASTQPPQASVPLTGIGQPAQKPGVSSQTPGMWKCPQCGSSLASGATFCGNCGFRV